MARLWKYVLILSLLMISFGILVGGTGILTGASVSRVMTNLNLAQRFDSVVQNIRALPFWNAIF